jgi:hypothetical protein
VDPNAPTVSRRTLRFFDGTQVAVNNLHEIMAELHSVGKEPNRETVDEIIAGLEALGNYIPPSEATRREYRNVLLEERSSRRNTRSLSGRTTRRRGTPPILRRKPERSKGPLGEEASSVAVRIVTVARF